METRVKSIITNRYDISLYQIEDGFQIMYESEAEGLKASEIINDYHTADFMFNMKVDELEGQ